MHTNGYPYSQITEWLRLRQRYRAFWAKQVRDDSPIVHFQNPKSKYGGQGGLTADGRRGQDMDSATAGGDGAMKLEKRQMDLIRALTQKVAERAGSPENDKARKLWSDHNHLQKVRPPVYLRIAVCRIFSTKTTCNYYSIRYPYFELPELLAIPPKIF